MQQREIFEKLVVILCFFYPPFLFGHTTEPRVPKCDISLL